VLSQDRAFAHVSRSVRAYTTRRPNFRNLGPPPTTRCFSSVRGERFRNPAASSLSRNTDRGAAGSGRASTAGGFFARRDRVAALDVWAVRMLRGIQALSVGVRRCASRHRVCERVLENCRIGGREDRLHSRSLPVPNRLRDTEASIAAAISGDPPCRANALRRSRCWLGGPVWRRSWRRSVRGCRNVFDPCGFPRLRDALQPIPLRGRHTHANDVFDPARSAATRDVNDDANRSRDQGTRRGRRGLQDKLLEAL